MANDRAAQRRTIAHLTQSANEARDRGDDDHAEFLEAARDGMAIQVTYDPLWNSDGSRRPVEY